MRVAKAEIRLAGRYDLDRLLSMGYTKVHYRGARYFYRFAGKLHRYTFIPVDVLHVTITISARSRSNPLPYELTFGQIDDWVKHSVRAIDLEKRR